MTLIFFNPQRAKVVVHTHAKNQSQKPGGLKVKVQKQTDGHDQFDYLSR